LSDAVGQEPSGGVYAAFATWYGGRVVRLTHHLERLVDSARRLGINLSFDRGSFVRALGKMLEQSGFGEAKIRISIAPRPTESDTQRLATVTMEPYAGPPREAKDRGIRCSLLSHTRESDPRAKQTDWMKERASLAPSDPVTEQLLVREDGAILEGASSNFYAITGGGTLITAAQGILFGTSRAILLKVAPGIVSVKLEPPQVKAIPKYAECFLSSASRGVVPIIGIDETRIGRGTPGPKTRLLMAAYDEAAESMAEPLRAPVA